jgi:hypothetical protein
MLRINIGTEDGLVNGVMVSVVGFEWSEGPGDDAARQPTAVQVLFDNSRVGQKGQQFAREREGIVGGVVPHTFVSIITATSRFTCQQDADLC